VRTGPERHGGGSTCLPKSAWARPRIPRVTTLHAAGVELDLQDDARAGAIFADEVVVAIPSLGHYKARRLRKSGARAAYNFELTEFSRRALGALIADRFPD
jgi:hypothetical protein